MLSCGSCLRLIAVSPLWQASIAGLMRRTLAGPNATGCAVNLFHHDFSVCDAYTGGLDAAAKVTPLTSSIS